MSDICRKCNGHDYVRTYFADEECGECNGEGMVYADDKEDD